MPLLTDMLEEVDFLGDSDVWVDASGREHTIASMSRRHAANVVKWLERRARPLHGVAVDAMAYGPQPTSDGAVDAFEYEFQMLAEQPPAKWLADQPLYRALVARAAGHKGGPSLRWRARCVLKAVFA